MKKKNEIIALIFFLILFSEHSNSFAQSGWFPLHSIYSTQMQSIYFINSDTGFVSISYSGGFKTTDGGNSWTQVFGLGGFGGGEIVFSPSNKVGYWGFSYTLDSGQTWTPDWNGKAINGHFFVLSDTVIYSAGITEGYTSSLLLGKKIVNSAWVYDTVVKVDSPIHITACAAIAFRDTNHGILNIRYRNDRDESDGGADFITFDGGKTWTHGHGGGLRTQYLFLHDSTWLFGAFDSPIYKTYDDFKHDTTTYGSTTYLNGCTKINNACIMAKSDTNNILAIDLFHGGLFRSTDAGNSWYKQFCFPSIIVGFNLGMYGSVSLPTRLVGYAVGIDSQIYKTIDGGGPPFTKNEVSVKNFTSDVSLSPNPTSGILSIRSASKNLTSISIFNILGEKVMEIPKPNAPEFEIDLSALPAGMYYAKFSMLNGVVTRKIIKE